MRVNYYISFIFDSGYVTDDILFKRDIFSDAPLDETLDTGIVVTAPDKTPIVEQVMMDIKPFTLCKITAKNADTGADVGEPKYYFTGDIEIEAVTLFQDRE